MLKLQGKEIGVGSLLGLQVQLVRTYKGEINRTQTGEIATFPNSFITVGLQIVLQGRRHDLLQIEQIMLSNDTVDICVERDIYAFRGAFSCTTNSIVELKDNKEIYSQLTLSLVSDGTPITKPNLSKFSVLDDMVGDTHQAYFGQVIDVTPGVYYNGFEVPSGKFLVLGDAVLTMTAEG